MSEKTKGTEDFEELLRKFQTLLPLRKAPKTLLEISRFPHHELACSNILAFFLDPSEEHGLGNMFLKSIFEAAECVENDLDDNGRLEIIREDRTDEKKSIDIVVVGNGFVLGIENKIFASASYNPFAQYEKRLLDRSGERRCHKILLSIRKEDAEDKCGFIPITYDEVFVKLEKHLGTKILTADQRCMAFLIDFINTIKNLKRGTHMDPKLLNFFAANEKTTHDLYTKTLTLIEELKSKGKEARKLVGEIKPPAIRNWIGKDESDSDSRSDCAYCIWCDGDLGNGKKIGIELQIRASGWRILIWPDGEADQEIVADFVENSGIKFTPIYEPTKIWIHAEFPYAEDSHTVALTFTKFVQSISKKLMEFQKRKT